MREIEGIVCTARSLVPIKQERLFGPRTGETPFSHQSFTTNGLIPFTDIQAAREALKELKERRKGLHLIYTGLAEVRMSIALRDDEFELLSNRKNFIVVAELEFGEMVLLGKKVAGVTGVAYAPVSNVELNGFKVITRYETAGLQMFGALYEVRRQGRPLHSYLATFELKRMKS
ncbi:MAG: hypothetical protein Q8R11_00350 [bacterium]|nr:hypothetical protein [bacterium]